MSKAAMLRARVFDRACGDETAFMNNVRALRDAMARPRQTHAWREWQDWFGRAFILRLEQNKADFERNVSPLGTIEAEFRRTRKRESEATVDSDWSQGAAYGDGAPTATTSRQRDTYRQCFQRLAYDWLSRAGAPCALTRTRDKLQRWRLTELSCQLGLQITAK